MKIIKLTENNLTQAVAASCEVLRNGGVVLLPTETVYGLVCPFQDKDAEERIYKLKMRDKNKRFAAFVKDYRSLAKYGLKITPLIAEMADTYCPGKITIIGECENGDTLGFRMPDHEFITALLTELDFPLSSTSANVSGEPNITCVEEAITSLNGEVDLVIDGGVIPENSLAST
ncbi:MAG: L-threonylcarbamoyladenylate synthase, partial [Lentisphaeria bacterium]|nr:L-threonylcarbamoyladenylate synthase [Lentisphaeria bacterium]